MHNNLLIIGLVTKNFPTLLSILWLSSVVRACWDLHSGLGWRRMNRIAMTSSSGTRASVAGMETLCKSRRQQSGWQLTSSWLPVSWCGLSIRRRLLSATTHSIRARPLTTCHSTLQSCRLPVITSPTRPGPSPPPGPVPAPASPRSPRTSISRRGVNCGWELWSNFTRTVSQAV